MACDDHDLASPISTGPGQAVGGRPGCRRPVGPWVSVQSSQRRQSVTYLTDAPGTYQPVPARDPPLPEAQPELFRSGLRLGLAESAHTP